MTQEIPGPHWALAPAATLAAAAAATQEHELSWSALRRIEHSSATLAWLRLGSLGARRAFPSRSHGKASRGIARPSTRSRDERKNLVRTIRTKRMRERR